MGIRVKRQCQHCQKELEGYEYIGMGRNAPSYCEECKSQMYWDKEKPMELFRIAVSQNETMLGGRIN